MLKAPRGTKDILPDEIARWRVLEDAARSVFHAFGYGEIRTPIFEDTSLFVRSVGETTDIVEKEMYTFAKTADGDTITLRPEATAPVVRAYLEHSLHKSKPFQKFYYIGPMFRYERPQAGRQRQFHQLGVEALGSADPALDAEMIVMVALILDRLGAGEVASRLNTAGCPACRPAYRDALKAAVADSVDDLCDDCKRRYERNVFRVLDCKNTGCRRIARALPGALDHVCDPCAEHFQTVRDTLAEAGIPHVVDPLLVRGLDYYTRTVFEVTSDKLGAQDTVAGGGRYDGLVSEFGGPDTPAVGFGMGMERALLLVADEAGASTQDVVDVYVAVTDLALHGHAWRQALALRRAGIKVALDHESRSLKAQMREANRLGARWVAIIGPDEIKEGVVTLRDMTTKKEERVTPEALVERLG